MHVRLALALVAFAAAGSALATLARPSDVSTEGGGYALAISAGSRVKLVDAAADHALLASGQDVLACRNVLHFSVLEIGARCRPATTCQVPGVPCQN